MSFFKRKSTATQPVASDGGHDESKTEYDESDTFIAAEAGAPRESDSGDSGARSTRPVRIRVHVLEVRDLVSKDPNGLCDPFVRIEAFAGTRLKQTATTEKKSGTLNAVYDDVMIFDFDAVDDEAIAVGQIRATVIDRDALTSNDDIGRVTLSVAKVRSMTKPPHACRARWFTLFNDDDSVDGPAHDGVQGYLQLSAAVTFAGEGGDAGGGPEDSGAGASGDSDGGADEDGDEQNDDNEQPHEDALRRNDRELAVLPLQLQLRMQMRASRPRYCVLELGLARWLPPLDGDGQEGSAGNQIKAQVQFGPLGGEHARSTSTDRISAPPNSQLRIHHDFATALRMRFHDPLYCESLPVKLLDRESGIGRHDDLAGTRHLRWSAIEADSRALVRYRCDANLSTRAEKDERRKEDTDPKPDTTRTARWLHFYGCQLYRRRTITSQVAGRLLRRDKNEANQTRAAEQQCRFAGRAVAYRGRVLVRATVVEEGGMWPYNGETAGPYAPGEEPNFTHPESLKNRGQLDVPKPGKYRLRLLVAAAEHLPGKVRKLSDSDDNAGAPLKRVRVAVAIGEHALLFKAVDVDDGGRAAACDVAAGLDAVLTLDENLPRHAGSSQKRTRDALHEQVPDVFVYLVAVDTDTGDQDQCVLKSAYELGARYNCFAYRRFSARDLLQQSKTDLVSAQWLRMCEDDALNRLDTIEFAGWLCLGVRLEREGDGDPSDAKQLWGGRQLPDDSIQVFEDLMSDVEDPETVTVRATVLEGRNLPAPPKASEVNAKVHVRVHNKEPVVVEAPCPGASCLGFCDSTDMSGTDAVATVACVVPRKACPRWSNDSGAWTIPDDIVLQLPNPSGGIVARASHMMPHVCMRLYQGDGVYCGSAWQQVCTAVDSPPAAATIATDNAGSGFHWRELFFQAPGDASVEVQRPKLLLRVDIMSVTGVNAPEVSAVGWRDRETIWDISLAMWSMQDIPQHRSIFGSQKQICVEAEVPGSGHVRVQSSPQVVSKGACTFDGDRDANGDASSGSPWETLHISGLRLPTAALIPTFRPLLVLRTLVNTQAIGEHHLDLTELLVDALRRTPRAAGTAIECTPPISQHNETVVPFGQVDGVLSQMDNGPNAVPFPPPFSGKLVKVARAQSWLSREQKRFFELRNGVLRWWDDEEHMRRARDEDTADTRERTWDVIAVRDGGGAWHPCDVQALSAADVRRQPPPSKMSFLVYCRSFDGSGAIANTRLLTLRDVTARNASLWIRALKSHLAFKREDNQQRAESAKAAAALAATQAVTAIQFGARAPRGFHPVVWHEHDSCDSSVVPEGVMPSLFTQSRSAAAFRADSSCAPIVEAKLLSTSVESAPTLAPAAHTPDGATPSLPPELETELAALSGWEVARQADGQGFVSSNSPAMNLLAALPTGSRTAKHGLYLVYRRLMPDIEAPPPAFAEFDDEAQQGRARRTPTQLQNGAIVDFKLWSPAQQRELLFGLSPALPSDLLAEGWTFVSSTNLNTGHDRGHHGVWLLCKVKPGAAQPFIDAFNAQHAHSAGTDESERAGASGNMVHAEEAFTRWNEAMAHSKDSLGVVPGEKTRATYTDVHRLVCATQRFREHRAVLQHSLEEAGVTGPFKLFTMFGGGKGKVRSPDSKVRFRRGRRVFVTKRERERRGVLKGFVSVQQRALRAGEVVGSSATSTAPAVAEQRVQALASRMRAQTQAGTKLIARLYVLRIFDVTPMDVSIGGRQGKSDPYVRLKVNGVEKANGRKHHLTDVVDADIYRCYETEVALPSSARLEVELMDYDAGFRDYGDDLIGRTVFDLEDRWLDPTWHDLGQLSPDAPGYRHKPIERRNLHISRQVPRPRARWELVFAPPSVGGDASWYGGGGGDGARHHVVVTTESSEHASKRNAVHANCSDGEVGAVLGRVLRPLCNGRVRPNVLKLEGSDRSVTFNITFEGEQGGEGWVDAGDARVPWLYLRGDGSLVVSIQSKADIDAGRAPQPDPEPEPEPEPEPQSQSQSQPESMSESELRALPYIGLKRRSFEQREMRPELVRGVLECWLDLLTPEDAAVHKPIDIRPPPKKAFEVRVVVWRTQDVQPEDYLTSMNDLYIKCSLTGAQRSNKLSRSTDTHWRLQNGSGSFNWRMLFDIELGHDTDMMKHGRISLQAWDKDVLKYNDCIAECVEDLTPFYRAAWLHHATVHAWRMMPTTGGGDDASYDRDEDEQAPASPRALARHFWSRIRSAFEMKRRKAADKALARALCCFFRLITFHNCCGRLVLPHTKRPNKRAHWFIKNRDGRQDCASITLGCWWLLCAAMRAVRLLLVVVWLFLAALAGASWDTLVRCCAAASAHSDEHASRAAYHRLESDEHMERVRDQVGIARLPFEFVRDALPDSPNARWLQMWKRRLRGNEWMSDMRGQVLVSCSIVPKEEAEREPVGSGRSEPNRHPYLPKPTGRISLSFLHPLSSCYQLLGAKLLKKVLLASLIIAVFSIGYYIIPNILGNLSTH